MSDSFVSDYIEQSFLQQLGHTISNHFICANKDDLDQLVVDVLAYQVKVDVDVSCSSVSSVSLPNAIAPWLSSYI